MAGRRASKIIESSDEEMDGVRLEEPQNTSNRPPRGAKEKASQAWSSLIPASKSDKADKESALKPKQKGESYGCSNHPAPDVDLHDSDDGRSKRKAAKKSLDDREPRRREKMSQVGKTRENSDSSSPSSDSDGSKSSDEDEEEEKTEASDLEEVEKNPRALEQLFESEAVSWADDNAHSPPPRSHSPRLRENRGRSASRSLSRSRSPPSRINRDRGHQVSRSRSRSRSPRHDRRRSMHRSPPISRDSSNSYRKKRAKHVTPDDTDSNNYDQRSGSNHSIKKAPSHDKSHSDDHSEERRLTTSHRGSLDKPSKVGGGQDKRHDKATAVSKSATAPRREEPLQAGSKRKKVCEDISWANASEDDRNRTHAPKRPRKHRSDLKRQHRSHDSDSSASDSGADGDTTDSEDSDDDCTDLVLRKHGGRLKLKKQRPRVRRIAKQAIEDVLINVCTVNAYPDGPDKTNDFAQTSLLRSAKALGDKEVARRVKHEEKYWKKLATIPLQRIPNFRGKIKKITDTLVKRTYGLKPGDALKVIWLQEGLRYIFPFNYENKTIVDTEPYGTPVFVEALTDAFFAKPRSYGYRIVSHFGSSLPEAPHEKEIPAAMLALVATALYASIDDYRNVRLEAGDFKSNLFIDIYRQNIAALSQFKSEKPGKYHRFMHALFKEVCTWTGAGAPHTQVKSFLNTKGMTDD
ncbi:hypothetical protein OH76DRAFT_1481588 [Lentinus brumalis]|uniref:DUF6532 domain-containing protein n=1 Tax=Lentinus brumalis TaxID=2498619 RepID=A0A371DFL4_9APHY|nr:hypothetical protein OH76DRAFT_1481588 [Polyporus brumalis]